MHKKIWITFSIITVVLIGLAIQIWTIIDTQPAAVASSQNARKIIVANTRGTIYDRHLQPLVNDTREYRVAVSPLESLLSTLYAASTKEQFTALRNQLVKGNPAVIRLTKPIGISDGLQLFYVPVRYGNRLLAPHVIGYLDSSGQQGVCGIERGYNQLLSSYNGHAAVSFSTDGSGRYLAGVQPKTIDTTAVSRGGLSLTLDKSLQMIIEDVGGQSIEKGAVIVLNPHSGDILAMASFPCFQPNTVSSSIQNNDGALLNRAISLYDCGSVFKIVATAAALENDVSIHTTFACNGYMDVEDTRFHCHNRLGHGTLTMEDAFAQSCNLYYIQLAQAIGAKALYSTAQNIGLQQPIVPAASIKAEASLLPALSTIIASEAALANLSFGQGYLLSTPLHIAQLTATIINTGIQPNVSFLHGEVHKDGKYTPITQEQGRRVLSADTAAALRSMMIRTVESGTGTAAALENVLIGGKTGTAETGQINLNGDRVVQSWFTGYMSYQENDYVITILCEDANNTNAKSTVVFHDIAKEIKYFLMQTPLVN